MDQSMSPDSWLSAVPGVIALVGGAIGIGSMHARLKAVEEDVKGIEALRTNVSTLQENVGRIDERTMGLVATTEKVDGKIDTIIANMLTDARTVLTRTPSRAIAGRQNDHR